MPEKACCISYCRGTTVSTYRAGLRLSYELDRAHLGYKMGGNNLTPNTSFVVQAEGVTNLTTGWVALHETYDLERGRDSNTATLLALSNPPRFRRQKITTKGKIHYPSWHINTGEDGSTERGSRGRRQNRHFLGGLFCFLASGKHSWRPGRNLAIRLVDWHHLVVEQMCCTVSNKNVCVTFAKKILSLTVALARNWVLQLSHNKLEHNTSMWASNQ